MNRNLRRVYGELLRKPGDPVLMQVVADALEDEGASVLANAYRWAAKRRRWPFLRSIYQHLQTTTNRHVYDWDGRHRYAKKRPNDVPAKCLLPKYLYNAIKDQEGRKYGGVNKAFILLARALEATKCLKQ